MSNVRDFVDALKKCEATTLKAPKLAALTGLNEQARKLMFEALSPYRVFGVKKYDLPTSVVDEDEDAEWFIKLLDRLASRELTGNAARDAVTNALALYTPDTQQYLARIIAKDLKAGFSETTLNKIYPGLVDRFGCMLAYKVDDSYEWTFPVLAEAKYDGTRTLALVTEKEVTYYSRNGKIAENSVGLFDEDLIALRNYYGMDMAFDGEALASNFTETLNAKRKSNTEAKSNMKFYVFDAIPLSCWREQKFDIVQSDRSQNLQLAIHFVKPVKVVKSKSRICNDYAEVRAFFKEMLEEGYEGLIVKKPDAPYIWDRDNAWAKIKPVFDYDGEVVGFYEGRGRNVGRLGGISIKGTDENGNYFESNVGSGFSDAMREEIWNNKEKYLGMTAQVEAQELSKSEARECFSLRFPIFVMFRTDK
jgi:DNA ligase-1